MAILAGESGLGVAQYVEKMHFFQRTIICTVVRASAVAEALVRVGAGGPTEDPPILPPSSSQLLVTTRITPPCFQALGCVRLPRSATPG